MTLNSSQSNKKTDVDYYVIIFKGILTFFNADDLCEDMKVFVDNDLDHCCEALTVPDLRMLNA